MKQNSKKFRSYSAKWKLILILVLLMSTSLVFIWLTQNVFLGKIYMDIKRSDLCDAGELLLKSGDSDAVLENAKALSEEGEMCIVIYRISKEGESREVIPLFNHQSHFNCNCMVHRLFSYTTGSSAVTDKNELFQNNIFTKQFILSAVDKVMQSGGESFIESENGEEFDGTKVDDLTRVAARTEKDGSVTAVFMNTSIVPLDSTTKTLNQLLIYIGVIVVLISVVFAMMIAMWITRPIEEINKTAKQLATCNYGVHFKGGGYTEIEELSETLNYAAEELSKADNLQKELIANISHDLRTPLTLITGYAEAMKDLPDENTPENLQIIIDEGNRMKTLVNDVLDISKITAGTAELVMSPISLTHSIESELTRYNKLRDREGYQIEFKYSEIVTVNGDYTRLMQVVYNLVNNAVNYGGEDKKVLVTQTVSKDFVRISVTDHGQGIEEDKLPLIWERYYKVDKTHKRATVGSGLGLSIVKGIVELHGGSCGATSKIGEGSTFYFDIPYISSTPLPDVPSSTVEENPDEVD